MGLIYTFLPEFFMSCNVVLHDCTQCHITTHCGLHLLTLQATKRLALAPGVIVTKAVLK